MLATQAPCCLTMPDCENVHASLASDVVGLCRAYPAGSSFPAPAPASDVRHVIAVAANVLFVLNKLVADGLLRIGSACTELRHAVDHIFHQMEAVEFIQHAHVERRARRALFLVAAHVEIIVAVPAI